MFVSANGADLNLFYSTSPIINNLYDAPLRMAIASSVEVDENGDGLVDRFETSLSMPLAPGEQIYGFSAVFYHQVDI